MQVPGFRLSESVTDKARISKHNLGHQNPGGPSDEEVTWVILGDC